MDYGTQCLIEILSKHLGEISEAIKDNNYQLERLNENIENVTGKYKGNAWINISAEVHQ